MVIGSLWFGPVFGAYWMKLSGLTKNSIKTMPLKPWQAMAIMFVLALLMAHVLSFILKIYYIHTGVLSVVDGLFVSAKIWAGFILPVTAGVFLWEGKSWKLWVLTAAYYLVALLAMSAILVSM
jgi:hypothetical protein